MYDDASFERQALRWLDDVYRFAMTLTRHRADAEDLVQETYLRAYRSWHTFRPGSDARRWLFTICRNCYLRTLARARSRREHDAISLDSIADRVATGDRPLEGRLLTHVELVSRLSDALDGLAEPYRSVIVLVDVEQRTYEAASALLRIPIGTVRSRLFRGRRLLRAVLEPVRLALVS
jgi:RNA polymerase sigma-70 factor (ECF subfamily)